MRAVEFYIKYKFVPGICRARSFCAKCVHHTLCWISFLGGSNMGTIEKRGRNSWRVGVQVLTDTGWQWIRETIKMPPGMTEARQRKEAEKALAQLTADANAGRIKPSQSPHTVRSFAAMWMEQHVRPNCKPTTCKDYQFFLDSRILPLIGDIQLKKLTPLILTKWINDVRASGRKLTRLPDEQLKTPRRPSDMAKMASPEKQAKPLSARTVQHYYDTLDAMLDKAVQWDILSHNPMDKVDRPKAKKAKAHYLTEERAVELLRCLRHEENMCYRAALLLALLCGLRLGEVGELRLSDVDWKNNTIDISRALIYTPQTGSYAGGTKTEAGERLISLPPGMMAVLHETREYQKEVQTWAGDLWKGEGWIVHGWNGARLHHDTPSKWFRRFADANGFEGVRFHDLRHTHATILLANSIDVVAVATRLGHSDASTTLKVYAHALRRRDEDAARAVQGLLDRAGDDLAEDKTE